MNNEETKTQKDTPVAPVTGNTGTKEADNELSKIVADFMLLLMAD